MPVARTHPTCWIPRAAETEFVRLLASPEAKILPITGGGGIGKTSLLLWCFDHCQENRIPALYLDLPRLTTGSALNMLLQLQTVHTPHFDQLRQALRSDERLTDLLKSYGDPANVALELLRKSDGLDEEYGKFMAIGVGLWKVVSQMSQRSDKQRHEQLIKQPEQQLLQALAQDFAQHGAILLDTLEQAGKQKLQTRLLFHTNGEIATRIEDTPQSETLLDYCAGLAGVLFQHPVVMLLAGRAAVRELKGRSPRDFATTLSLPAFTMNEIQTYLQANLPQLPPAQPHDLEQLKIITRGNPLLLERVAALLSDWDGWAWQAKQWAPLRKAYESDPDHGLLLYVTQRLADHIQTDDRAFWRLALPRHYIQHDMADILFPVSEFGAQSGMTRLKAYAEKGIVFAGRGENLDKYYLHDETRAALQAWAEREKCWLDSTAEQLHAQLGAWLMRESDGEAMVERHKIWSTQEQAKGIPEPAECGNPLLLDAAYHLVMADAGFEQRYAQSRTRFWKAFSVSISLSNALKLRIGSALPTLSPLQIDELTKVFDDEASDRDKRYSFAARRWLESQSEHGQLPLDWEKNETFLTEAVKCFPEEPEFLGNFALFMQTIRQDYDQAESLYQRAIAADDKHAGNFAIFLHVYRKDYAQAQTLYLRALALDPNHANLMGNLAQLYLQSGALVEGRVWLDKAFAAQPEEPALQLELWFYRYAHFPAEFPQAAGEIQALLDSGARSVGWDLSGNLAQAEATHPDFAGLQALAAAIVAPLAA